MKTSTTLIYRKHFADELTAILKDNLAEDQAEDFAQTLAHACARDERLAVDKVNEVLASIGLSMDDILHRAQVAQGQTTRATVRAARAGAP